MVFIVESLKKFKEIGAIAPSSSSLAQTMITSAQLKLDSNVVEIGPGTGIFTQKILENIPAHQYLGIEINSKFITHLRRNHPNAQFFCDSAQNITKILDANDRDKCDRIICGLPWTNLPPNSQKEILIELHKSMKEEALLTTFAYTGFSQLPQGRAFYKLLKKTFSKVEKTKTVVKNLPPAFIYICRK